MALRGGGLIMALRYWVGGTGTWDNLALLKWSLTSGGVGGQAVPTSADDVIFNSASGINTVTIATGAICGTLSTTGFRGTVAFGTNAIEVATTAAVTCFTGNSACSVSGTPLVNITGNTSNTRTIAGGSSSDANSISFNISAGSGTISVSGTIRSLIFSGSYTGAYANTTHTISGDLTLKSGMTVDSGTSVRTFSSALRSQNITSAALNLNSPITFNGTTTTVSNTLATTNITFSGNINTIPSATFAFINSLTSNAQAQLTNLATKLTAISYESSNTTTTIAGDLIFNGTLNSISATTFGYLSGLSGAIQTQLNSLSTRIATFELVGTIIMSPLSDLHTTSGNKYLHCTGQIVSRTTYSALFAKIGTNFGAGDGSTTFAVPNYQGLFFRGMGGQVINGTTYTGVSVNSAQQDAVQDHQHGPQGGAYLGTTTSASNSGGYLNSPLQRPNQYNFDNTGTMISGRTNSVETRPVNVGIYYYIKT